jgi:hypothetical protein
VYGRSRREGILSYEDSISGIIVFGGIGEFDELKPLGSLNPSRVLRKLILPEFP